MLNSHATIPTNEAARLIKRLCAHWAHKFAVEAEPNLGRIDFGETRCQLSSDDQGIRVDLYCPDEATTSRMQDVVFDHLQRMGKSELPQPVWSSSHVE